MARFPAVAEAEVYHDAARERLADALLLYENEHYVFSLYASGVAAECMFRAYRMKVDPVFDSRHNLSELCKASRLKRCLNERQEIQLSESLSLLASTWRNDQRYGSTLSIRRFLKREKRDRGIKGDALKEAARRAYNASEFIVSTGVKQWTS